MARKKVTKRGPARKSTPSAAPPELPADPPADPGAGPNLDAGALGMIARQDKLLIVYLELATVRPVDSNPRKHPPRQIEALKRSLVNHGWLLPLLVDADMNLIVGHGRLIAALQLGCTEAPFLVITHLTPEQVDAYRVLDNRLAEMSLWDEDKLAVSLRDLRARAVDVSELGFSASKLDHLLADQAGAEAPASGDPLLESLVLKVRKGDAKPFRDRLKRIAAEVAQADDPAPLSAALNEVLSFFETAEVEVEDAAA